MLDSYKIQVRFSDLDVLGHVNNAVYLSYFEMARVAYFSKFVGVNWDWEKQGVLLRKNEIEYLYPVFLHQEPEIKIYTKNIGTKSFTLDYGLTVNNILCTTGSSVLVCYDSIAKKTIEIPKELMLLLKKLKKEE